MPDVTSTFITTMFSVCHNASDKHHLPSGETLLKALGKPKNAVFKQFKDKYCQAKTKPNNSIYRIFFLTLHPIYILLYQFSHVVDKPLANGLAAKLNMPENLASKKE